jgi:transposase-like protein
MIQPRRQVGEKWRSLVAEQAESGQSMAAFCRARQVPQSQFYYWKQRLQEAATPPFVEVRVARPRRSRREVGSATGSAIEVRLSNGRSLVVAPGFEAGHLRALLAVVERES